MTILKSIQKCLCGSFALMLLFCILTAHAHAQKAATQDNNTPTNVAFQESTKILSFDYQTAIYATLIFYKSESGKTVVRATNRDQIKILDAKMIPNSVILYTITQKGETSKWVQPKLYLEEPSSYLNEGIKMVADPSQPIDDLRLANSGQVYFENLVNCKQKCKINTKNIKKNLLCLRECLR